MDVLDLLSVNENKEIRRIVNFHEKNNLFPAACLVGSLAKGYFSETSDLDLMIFVDTEEIVFEELSQYVSELGYEPVLNDDAYDFNIDERNVSILYKSYPEFISKIKGIVAGNYVDMYYKEWAFIGVIDDVLLLDIANAILFYDDIGEFENLSAALKLDYPISMKSSIMKSSENLIKVKANSITKFKQNPFIASAAANELLTSYIRYLYAKHELYNPGLKHIFSKNNIKILKVKIPELVACYEIYCNCTCKDYEPLAIFIMNNVGGK